MSRKAKLYARSGVREYWMVDVENNVIHQMWSPEGEVYAERRKVAFGETVTAATIAAFEIETSTLA